LLVKAPGALVAIAVLLVAAGTATCVVGVRHEISQNPAAQRAQMTDFDWIGVEWIELGAPVVLLGTILGGVGVARGVVPYRRRTQREQEGARNVAAS
jgi:hypothetical protein